ncbi:conserved hypothetical protein [Talaromyces stipitatus ATCC 10500]|uniref:C6 transcription factor n=1 Tax=Talaromyces stipitatus (strain ATCC 10500 / CBS 375.48 / QM 6759 / NRRL 1006) TaxID=441959 RepID=B8MF73_TALSN|nr:uncharacterized protein TSTA_012790 [Talaromyces stipitatus ATCC 10500]EED16172.1 conserved hypothetical protein [Talaromyces stipitatus ATCC 10500]
MDFRFVNVKTPKDALQLAKEPEIRSHVTRHQWKQFGRRDKRQHGRKRILPSITHDMNGAKHSADLFTPESISIAPQIGGLRVDPFRSYPVSIRSWTPLLVDHYLIHMAVDIPELDLPGNHGLLRTSWFPLVMSEPALFSVIILLAASHYASLQGGPSSIKLDLLNLRCEALLSIKRSLDAQHIVHDALIGAIAKMASYEAMFGSLENYDIHMQGLARAVSLRGGLPSLGLNGLLHRMVLWIDRNAAFLHGLPMYFFADTDLPGDPNPGHFLGSS